MKKCSKCLIVKDESNFYRSSKNLANLESWCKDCKRLLNKESSGKYIESRQKAKVSAIARNKTFIFNWLNTHPCVDCGETDAEVLEFDHVVSVGKSGKRIGDFMSNSLARLELEILKCEVRCGNCHTRKTRRESGWYRSNTEVVPRN